jgi:DNA-binding transcriptional regulator YiaG
MNAADNHQRWKDREVRKIVPPPSPDPDEVRDLRELLGYSQTQAAALIYVTMRRWQGWEHSQFPMHPALWELFQSKAAAILRHRDKGPPSP